MSEAVSDRECERQELLREISDNVGVAAFAYFPTKDGAEYQSHVNKPIHWPGWSRPTQEKDGIDDKEIGTIVFSAFGSHYRTTWNGPDEAISFVKMTFDINEDVSDVVEQINLNRTLLDIILRKNKTIMIPTHRYRKIGVETVKHSDMIDGGKDEPAYHIGILFKDHLRAFRHTADKSTRTNQAWISLFLPESVALKLWREIDEDPLFTRRVLELIYKETLKVQCDDFYNPSEFLPFKEDPSRSRDIYIIPPHKFCDIRMLDRPEIDPAFVKKI